MVDAVVQVFLDKLLNALSDQSQIITTFRRQFQKLQDEVQLLQCLLKDAERLKRKNETLKWTMANLRELIYDAEDILADCLALTANYGREEKIHDHHQANPFHVYVNSHNSVLCLPSINVNMDVFSLKYLNNGKRLRDIHSQIIDIKVNISSCLGTVLPLSEGHVVVDQDLSFARWSSSVFDHNQVIGLEEDTRKIKDWLFQSAHPQNAALHFGTISAVGVVGMGGLGKTTVTQKVFNDKQVDLHFDKRIWVSVSQTFTEKKIMLTILRNLGDTSIGDDLGDILKKINQHLQGKRFLIVMDDVWKEDDNTWWLNIYNGLPKGSGSCIIVTTRIENVARKMGVQEARLHYPEFLSADDAFWLFCRVAFAANGGHCEDQKLLTIGKDIVDRCGGLPLAIKAAGGMMLCKSQNYYEWRRIADNFKDDLQENGNSVMASLQLSYDELPPFLKSCFLSLSLYPEDCIINKDQLVRWWIGEGFVPRENCRVSTSQAGGGRLLITEAGEDCFVGLINRCLVEQVDRDYNGDISSCKVHDMVRDLAIKIAAEDAFSGYNIVSPGSRHLGLNFEVSQKRLFLSSSNKKLRALVSTTRSSEINKIDSYFASKFTNYRYLRVLDLSKSIFEEPFTRTLLSKISCLKHLVCLNLSNTHPLNKIPASVGKLQNLKILDLSYCQNLKCLPPFITDLTKLVVLDVGHCGSLDYLPKGLGKLSNLQVLHGFKPARLKQIDGSRISELRNLKQLRKLELQLTWTDQIDDSDMDALTHLKHLQNLTMSCSNSLASCEPLVCQIEQLYPPSELLELSLNLYPGKVSPRWLNPSSLPTLRYLALASGNLEKMSISFWNKGDAHTTWMIEGLRLEALYDLRLEWIMLSQCMQYLRIVHASWCPKLRSFPIEGVGFKGGVWKRAD